MFFNINKGGVYVMKTELEIVKFNLADVVTTSESCSEKCGFECGGELP